MKTFNLNGYEYPEYLRDGNASANIIPIARHWCRGTGLDIGAGKYPLTGAIPIDPFRNGGEYHATRLPSGSYDYIFSSHCLEHLPNWIEAVGYWFDVIKPGGTVFLYLPHPANHDWHPKNNRAHKHILEPADVSYQVRRRSVISYCSGMDLFWSYSVVGVKK